MHEVREDLREPVEETGPHSGRRRRPGAHRMLVRKPANARTTPCEQDRVLVASRREDGLEDGKRLRPASDRIKFSQVYRRHPNLEPAELRSRGSSS